MYKKWVEEQIKRLTTYRFQQLSESVRGGKTDRHTTDRFLLDAIRCGMFSQSHGFNRVNHRNNE